MPPPRRVRDEYLVLRREGAPDRLLAERSGFARSEQLLPSQRRFQVAPDARALAYVSPANGELRLLRRDGAQLSLPGVWDRDIRFSPDGRMLAVAREEARRHRIDRIDVRRMEVEPWAELSDPRWMEYCAEGLVVAHGAPNATITRVSWEGRTEVLAEPLGLVSRVSAAALGRRTAYLANRNVWTVEDVASTPRPLLGGDDPIDVTNMELSPDGGTLAFATQESLRICRGSAVEQIQTPDVHTIWFSRDGAELSWAAPYQAIWRKGGTEKKLVPEDGISRLVAMRFLRGGAGLVVCRGHEVLRWNPERDEQDVLTRVDDGRELIGADVFDGGIVLWLAAPWSTIDLGSRRQFG